MRADWARPTEETVSRFVAWIARIQLRPLLIFLAVGIALMAVMGIGALILDRGNPWFDLDSEIAIAWPITQTTIALPALWSGLLLIAAAAAWIGAWSVWPHDRARPLILIIALFFVLMSGDELAGLHERLEKRLGVDWQVLYALPVALMAIATITVLVRMRRFERRGATVLLLGCGAWAISQILEFVQWRGDEEIAIYVYLMVPEELLEATGSALFLVSGILLVKALVAARVSGPGSATAAAADPTGAR